MSGRLITNWERKKKNCVIRKWLVCKSVVVVVSYPIFSINFYFYDYDDDDDVRTLA